MHILNENSNEKLNRISLFFTESEAINLLSYLESLVKGKNGFFGNLRGEKKF